MIEVKETEQKTTMIFYSLLLNLRELHQVDSFHRGQFCNQGKHSGVCLIRQINADSTNNYIPSVV